MFENRFELYDVRSSVLDRELCSTPQKVISRLMTKTCPNSKLVDVHHNSRITLFISRVRMDSYTARFWLACYIWILIPFMTPTFYTWLENNYRISDHRFCWRVYDGTRSASSNWLFLLTGYFKRHQIQYHVICFILCKDQNHLLKRYCSTRLYKVNKI